MSEPGFWNDSEKAREVSREQKMTEDRINGYKALKTRIDEIETLAELAEDDDDMALEVLAEIGSLKDALEERKVEILLSGEYDDNDAILSLHVGVGGTDAQDWTQMLLRMYTRWADKKGYKVEVLDIIDGDEA
ncbi:MAG: PCRF domain-containing protein, partial [Youngiibacter sp.]|nr:PCRF domain-containing protein [Youngiibacter sp.]